VRNADQRKSCNGVLIIENKLEQPVRLEPLSRFPVIRHLAVDRSVLLRTFKRVKAWVPVDGTYDLGAGPRISPKAQEEMYPLSRCISCCLDLQQPWQRFNTEHELTTKGIEKFVADYRATLYQAAS
jgi:succinate dehydrogenase / fumarate reductase, iron-sulfur subunit